MLEQKVAQTGHGLFGVARFQIANGPSEQVLKDRETLVGVAAEVHRHVERLECHLVEPGVGQNPRRVCRIGVAGFAGVLALLGITYSLLSGAKSWTAAGVAGCAAVAAFGMPLKLNIVVAIAAGVAAGLLLDRSFPDPVAERAL